MTEFGAALAREQPPPDVPESGRQATASGGWEGTQARLRRIFDEQFDFVWRYLRRLGLGAADADDAAQQVFIVLARKLDQVDPDKERAFLCGTLLRVCSEHRRALARRPEVAGEAALASADVAISADEVADRQRARELLDCVLGQMDMDVRSVFVLFELEEMSTAQIAELLGLPAGTVASRLRRARESFKAIVRRMRAGGKLPGGER
ncbi:MAG: sigma-70 family RNA polymerase sigma factor [Deltaproteobacteria bacterium]|nr:sigma-70 family RNA polymerase sigma factor [Deltaproteobacteria bacterium]